MEESTSTIETKQWESYKLVITGLVILTAVRIVLSAVTEVSPDEAYYFMWSERLAPSYYSKGPGVAVAMKLSSAVFGKSAIGIRLCAPLLALMTSLVIFRLARSLYSEQVGIWAVVILNITPLFNAGGVLMTIDPLSIFFWVAAMFTLWRALHRAAQMNKYWILTGLLIGLGFLCKYTNALQLLSIVLLFVVSRRWRGQLVKPGFYLMLLTFVVCTIPVLIWNHSHHWITVTHLKERGKLDEATGISPLEFAEYFGMHLGVYSPILFLGLLWALVTGVRQFFKSDSDSFLVAFSAPIIALYFALSWREAGEANWTGPGFVGVGILLAHHWQNATFLRKRGLQIAAVSMAIAFSAISFHTDIVRQLGIPWPYERDPSSRLRGWRETADVVGDIIGSAAESREQQGMPNDLFVIANRWQMAAILSFYLEPGTPVIRPNEDYPVIHTIESPIPVHQFSFWPRYDTTQAITETSAGAREPNSPFVGKTALYITDDADRERPPSTIRKTFELIEPKAIFTITRGGKELRRVKVFACYNYRSLPL